MSNQPSERLELQLEQSHERHREALKTWQVLYEELKLKHGRAARHFCSLLIF